ncbi:unnamed protein product [Adineta ricciae]|uniref:Uncharacterized protein n=1 Tax=Adineta ricciae TaxID=249248 RepID=A0A814S6J5_ADIRI|nr:unnamed protein product [Adineta ricciae]
MPPSTSSNITSARRKRRSNKQYRHRHELLYVINHPTMANVMYYTKHFFLKSAFVLLAENFEMVTEFYHNNTDGNT